MTPIKPVLVALVLSATVLSAIAIVSVYNQQLTSSSNEARILAANTTPTPNYSYQSYNSPSPTPYYTDQKPVSPPQEPVPAPGVPVPSTPVGLTTTKGTITNGLQAINLSWTRSTEAGTSNRIAYRIYRKLVGVTNYVSIGGSTSGGSDVSASYIDHVSSGTYTYTVQAYDSSPQRTTSAMSPPSSPVTITIPPPVIPITKFKIGDTIVATAVDTNVRSASSIYGTIIAEEPLGEIGQVVGGPVPAPDHYTWYKVNFDRTGDEGWVAEGNIGKAFTITISPVPVNGYVYSVVGGSADAFISCGDIFDYTTACSHTYAVGTDVTLYAIDGLFPSDYRLTSWQSDPVGVCSGITSDAFKTPNGFIKLCTINNHDIVVKTNFEGPPYLPANLVATTDSSPLPYVTLDWWSSASNFKVYRASGLNPPDTSYSYIGSNTYSNYFDFDVSANTTYSYKVTALNGDQESARSDAVSVTTMSAEQNQQKQLPEAPTPQNVKFPYPLIFRKIKPANHTLTILPFIGGGSGYVTSQESPAPYISCGSGLTKCSHVYPEDTIVVLTAYPNNGSSFGFWAIPPTTPQFNCEPPSSFHTVFCNITPNQDKRLTAWLSKP